MSATEQRRLSKRSGLVLSVFTPTGRSAAVVSVQWLARNNLHTFGQPESWAATTLTVVAQEHLESKT